MFRKILIANRGEIAVRIIRTCREMAIRTVAVFSEADRLALHVRMADEAYFIGAAPAKESYLVGEKIIEVARKAGAEAIHPGYGFLAENADFAEAVADAGLVFIGPSAESMRKMGDKVAARQLVKSTGVPIVPGAMEPIADAHSARSFANDLGYPVLLKAAAGGGGKGMRVVRAEEELPSLFRTASSEALSAFGDGRVYLEKYLERPRHIEFQIFGDEHGNIIHLNERECSIQRRHQKVIEESPSCLLDEKMRRQMSEAAVAAARSSQYTNAGTIEFIVDRDRRFYFLEMNTRLQVEHPVTEAVTGLDLVKLQLEVAAGNPLPIDQSQVRPNGHALECRVYAEDPDNDFVPSIGRLTHLQKPGGLGVREDSGVEAGSEVTVYYDPMIAKLIAWGSTREQAIQRMRRALNEYEIGGVKTTVPFCLWVLNHESFNAGEFDTHFVQNEFISKRVALDGKLQDQDKIQIAAALAAVLKQATNSKAPLSQKEAAISTSLWKQRGWKEALRRD